MTPHIYSSQAVALSPENKYYRLLLAEILSNQNRLEEATAILEDLVNDVEGTEYYLFDLASLYLYQSKFEEALVVLDKAESYFGVIDQISFQKQRIYLRLNKLDQAIAEGKTLIEKYPGDGRYVLTLVEILAANNRTREAISLIKESLAINPDQPTLDLTLYKVYKLLGEKENAAIYLKKSFDSPDLAAEDKAKVIADMLREYPSADLNNTIDKLAAQIIDMHPENDQSYGINGDVQLARNNKEEALGYYRQANELNKENEKVWSTLLSLLLEKSDWENLYDYSLEAVEYFEEKPEFRFFLGTAQLIQKDYDGAIEALEKANELVKNNKELKRLINSQLGDAYYGADRPEDAFETYEKVLIDFPEDAQVLNNYSYYLALQNKNLNRAKVLSAQLVKLYPRNANYLDTHAWVLFKLGDYKSAKEYQERALSLTNNPSAEMLEHLGDILSKLGDSEGAVTQWKRAKEKMADSATLSEKIATGKYQESQ